MRDLSHLAADCLACTGSLKESDLRRGQPSPWSARRDNRLGNCDGCRTERCALIREWEQLGTAPTERLLKYAFNPDGPDSWRKSVTWWLAERRAPAEAADASSNHLRRCQDSGQPIAALADRSQPASDHPVAAAPPR